MDAQNAAESPSTKQLASPKEADSGADALKSKPTSATATNLLKSPTNNNKGISLAKDSRPATITSNVVDEDASLDQNSDAETIVLPGKDSISPSKPRKAIKHEDKSDEEMNSIPRPRKPLKDTRDADRNGGHSDDATSISLGRRKKRQAEKEKQRPKENSAAPGSAPHSPIVHYRTGSAPFHRRRRSGGVQSESESESSKSRSHKVSQKDETKIVERHPPGKRKSVKTESDDEGEARKARRTRISDTGVDTSVGVRDRDYKISIGKHTDKQHGPRNRSTSPPSRIHRRSVSTQLPSQSLNGLSSKKRRVPAPLQSTEYQSDDSSASGSPHPRSSRIKNIATPITGESTISPARIPGHKKHVDNHGQTLFAKACAKGEYETAKKRLAERPEDLNFADYAGNTPLQVASLNGHEDIVQLLIEAGCNLDCRNSDKETPLLDAVENGHLGVVKLLLKAGVNPRKADAEGHEPLEKVPDDLDNAEEIRAALREAKERVGEMRRTSEDHQPQDLHDTLSSHGPDSPRESPVAPMGSLLAEKRRGGTVRSTKTSNHLLYMNLDDKTLRQAAARGDNETVTRVLQVKERCDDPEALVNAARGGHNVVVELLLALGGANPDPRPVPGLPIEHGTPMLAAIGQENIEVIKLLLNANGFNPTRQYKGQTYYEIARRREGPNWKEEEHILKEAYDHFKKGSKGSSKSKPSPNRRERELDQDSRRGNRAEPTSDAPRPQKRRTSASPSRDSEPKKKPNFTKAAKSPREKRRSLSFGTQDENTSPKRGPGRPKRDGWGSNTASSDREISPVRSKNAAMPKLIEPEVAGSSDGEAIKPRRKLISGKDLNRQRERQRRESLASNVSGLDRSESKGEESSEKPRGDREKHLSRTKILKREESTERLSTIDASGKRHRSSASPSRRGLGDKEDNGAPMKRRKLDTDVKERRYLEPPSPESRHTKRELSRDSIHRQRHPDNDRREVSKPTKLSRDHTETERLYNSDKSITVASEDPDVEMRDSIQVSEEEGEIPATSEKEGSKKQRKRTPLEPSVHDEIKRKDAEHELQERGKRKQEEEMRRKEQEAEKKRLEVEERSRLELEELKRKEAAEKARLEEERRLKEEEKKLKEEEERKKKEQEELRLREEQERRQREERERQQREEEQRRQQEELQRLQREEEMRIQREEEERIQREKEAAEEARRLREEEERREREREEAARVAREQELQRAEQERIRVSKLPPLLRWLNICSNPKQREIAELFVKAQGVRYDTIDPSATGKAGGRDQWLLSTQVALLLGEKDLSLSRCKRPRSLMLTRFVLTNYRFFLATRPRVQNRENGNMASRAGSICFDGKQTLSPRGTTCRSLRRRSAYGWLQETGTNPWRSSQSLF